MVYRWCRQWGLDAEDARDVHQEVFIAVFSHVSDFRRDDSQSSFRAWLCTITRNKLRDRSRRQGQAIAAGGTTANRRLMQIPEPPAGAPTVELADEVGLVQRAALLVKVEFEDRTWQMFWRNVGLGQKPAEIAAAFDVSVSAVYQAKSRVLRRLREELDGDFC